MLAARIALASLFTVLGVAGLFLPILQGWLFLLLAFVMFFPRHRLSAATVTRIENRFPRFGRFMRRFGAG